MNTPAPQGHNSDGQAKAFFERMKKLEIEKREIAEDQKELAKEIASAGLKAKLVRKMVADDLLTESQKAKRDEEAELLDMYRASIR